MAVAAQTNDFLWPQPTGDDGKLLDSSAPRAQIPYKSNRQFALLLSLSPQVQPAGMLLESSSTVAKHSYRITFKWQECIFSLWFRLLSFPRISRPLSRPVEGTASPNEREGRINNARRAKHLHKHSQAHTPKRGRTSGAHRACAVR